MKSQFGKFYKVVSMLLAVIMLFVVVGPASADRLSSDNQMSSLDSEVVNQFKLMIDANRNQISDAVESEVALIKSLPAEQQSAEIERFVSRLPISKQSRGLQARAQQLTMSLSTATPEQAQATLQEIAKISAELQKDPAIAKFQGNIQKLTGQGVEKSSILATASFSSLKKGDILARRSGLLVLWPWAMIYEHTGNYYGNSQVYESNADGVRLKPLSSWQKKGAYVGLARNNKKPASTMSSAVDWAITKYGSDGRTPYNYILTDKLTDSRLYCSQLSWKINRQAGVDIDSNAWQYHLWASILYGAWVVPAIMLPAVAPDEIMLDKDVTVYSKGWN